MFAVGAENVGATAQAGDFDGDGYDDVLLRNVETLESVYHAVTADGTPNNARSR